MVARSGVAAPDSHLLTAWRLTPTTSPSCSWVRPAALRTRMIRSFNSIGHLFPPPGSPGGSFWAYDTQRRPP